MSYADFIIFKEHKFLTNIFSNEDLAKTNRMKNLKTFHEKSVRFLKIVVFLQNAFNTYNEFEECFNEELVDFVNNHCEDCSDFAELKDVIVDVKIKHSRTGSKISQFTLQVYAFVYQRLMDFPQGRFDYETLTTVTFFENIIDKSLSKHTCIIHT